MTDFIEDRVKFVVGPVESIAAVVGFNNIIGPYRVGVGLRPPSHPTGLGGEQKRQQAK